jgi:hypothetical protein
MKQLTKPLVCVRAGMGLGRDDRSQEHAGSQHQFSTKSLWLRSARNLASKLHADMNTAEADTGAQSTTVLLKTGFISYQNVRDR